MSVLGQCQSSQLRGVAVAALAGVVSCCGGRVTLSSQAPPFAVVSAFPAELAPHLERATISRTMVVNGHLFRVGTLAGVPVVLGLTGIGLLNAAATTRALLAQVDVQGVVFSGVAGSTQIPIGDVAVPEAWEAKDGTMYPADPSWLDLAKEIAGTEAGSLERCTVVPTASQEPVCLPQQPAVVVGGVGLSSDLFGTKPFQCVPGGGDIFGCDVDSGTTASEVGVDRHTMSASVDTTVPVVDDMETVATAREAAARNVPFIAFRAVSDGPGDPLGLGGFIRQFPAYYHLAASNASSAAVAFIEQAATVMPVRTRAAAVRSVSVSTETPALPHR